MELRERIAAFFKSHGVKNFISHFVQGLIIIAPLAITAFIFYKVLDIVHSTFGFVGKIIHPLIDPFILLALVVLVIYGIGKISASLVFTPVYDRFEKDIVRVPLIRQVYTSIKDIISAFVGSKRKFNQPVLVTLDRVNNVKQIGFLTQTDLTTMTIDKEYMAVYLPFSYGFSGKLIIVHKDSVTPLNVSSTEAMKFVVSGGVTHVD